MRIQQTPILSAGLAIVCAGLFALHPHPDQLYFSADLIGEGQWWRAVTGHFIHADSAHLFWNCLGLLVLGTMLEYRSRKALLAALAGGIVAVNILLLSPWPQLDYYCGMSGMLNTLLIVVLWREWQQQPSALILMIAILCLAKAAVESLLGVALFTNVSWQPYALSHVAGLAGGLCLIMTELLLSDRHTLLQCAQKKQCA